MSTVQQPIVVNQNEPLSPATVSSPSLQYAVNQTIAVKDFNKVAIVPISPSASNITFNEFTGSISYNPYPYSIEANSTTSNVNISNNAGNKINLLGYSQVDVDLAGTIQTLAENTDYALNKNIVVNNNNPTILNALNDLPFDLFEFESIQIGNYIYLIGGLSGISVSDTTVTKTYSNACYYAYVNENGVLSDFQATAVLPAELTRGFLTYVGNTLFYMGGENSSGVVDTIYQTTVNANGTLNAWTTSAVTLPLAGSYVTGITVNGYIYILNLFPGPKSDTTAPLTSMDYYYTTVSSGSLNAWTDGGSSLFGDAFYYGGKTLLLGTTIYVLGGMDYNGGFHSGVYTIAISQTNTLSAAVDTNNNLPAHLYDFNILNINNNLYLIGAYDNDGLGGYSITTSNGTTSTTQTVNLTPVNYSVPIIYTAPTASDTIGPWTVFQNTLPSSVCRGGTFYNNNKIYFVGGINIVANTSPSATGNDTAYSYTPNNAVYAADLLLGNIETFHTPYTLPANQAQYQTIQVGNRLYAVGGYNNGIANTSIYYAFVKEDDTLSEWYTSNTVLPAGVWGFSLVSIQNYIYLIGGFDGSGPVNSVYACTINSDNSLTPFILVGNIPEALTNATTYVGNNSIYLLGGLGTSQPNATIYMASINSSGAIGNWTTTTNVLPLGLRNASSFVLDSTLFVFGNSSTVPANNIGYSIPINANGSLGSVNTTAISLPATTSQYLTPIVINDTIYLFGNNNSTSTTYDIFTATVSGGVISAWATLATNLPVGTISQSVFNINNMLYVIGVTDNVNYYNRVYTFILNFNYSYSLALTSLLSSIPTKLFLTQFVYGSGILASGGYLQTLTINSTVYSKGTYTYNYEPIYNTNNGDTVYLQFNNMNRGDCIVAFRGVITGTEAVPESSLTT